MADWKESNPIIKRENVLMVYSGIAGCMCGCLGNYRMTQESFAAKAKSGQDVSYDKINEAQVTRVLKKMATLTDVEVGEIYGKEGDSLIYLHDDQETRRRYAVYTKPGAPYTKPEIPVDPSEAERDLLKILEATGVV